MESIAIVGTGIAGMAAGYFLKDKYDITFYEKNNYPGGHTNSVAVNEDGQTIYIDTGFMVYNEVTYPNLTRLFRELNIQTMPTSMSFSVQHLPTGLEYRGTDQLFCQKKNLFNLSFIKMLLDIDRFSRECEEVLRDEKYQAHTIADYVKEKKFSDDLLMKFLMPMGSAVWSIPSKAMLEFPIVTLVRFFKNHGFLGLKTQHQWFTVIGGSRNYRDKILWFFKNKVSLNRPAVKITRENGKVAVEDAQGVKNIFDKVVIASHGDEALSLLGNATSKEQELLRHFSYQHNKATLHTDSSVMPKTKAAWASWNYRMDVGPDNKLTCTTIYDMNSLQQVSKKENYFVSINDPGLVDRKKVLWEADYTHPIYTVEAIKTQPQLKELNTQGGIYFCGSYFRYGFHEDALTSAVEVIKAITGQFPTGYRGF